MIDKPEARFPPPWSVEETAACFIVKDHTGMSLAYALSLTRDCKPRKAKRCDGET